MKFLFLTFFLIFCISCTHQKEENSPPLLTLLPNTPKKINLEDRKLISHQQLSTWQIDSPTVILIDTRPDSSFQKGHLKGAFSLWRPDIQSDLFPYKGMMLEKGALELILGKFGATSNSIFVLYDNNGNVDAARLWWILTTYGHSSTYLLNGGLQSAPKGLENQEITTAKSTKFLFSNKDCPNLKANKEDVLAALTDSNTILLDCRTLDEFTGKTIKKNAFRSGHIPTAIHLNYTHSIAYHQAYQFKSDQELALIFQAIPKDKKIIVYCQSGVRSAHTTFVLHKLLGFPNVSNYDGSWIEWSHDKTLAIEVGL
jgi:thiosulfate/3-mercaptopyruvate sulfurtransferase